MIKLNGYKVGRFELRKMLVSGCLNAQISNEVSALVTWNLEEQTRRRVDSIKWELYEVIYEVIDKTESEFFND